MKKNYILALAVLLASSVTAQTIDFESMALAPDTFDNGADESGGFQFDDVFFTNYYDTTYDYNTGFSITNKKDDTTSGFTNSHSAITAGGDNSENYAMFYSNGTIDLTGIEFPYINTASFTNSTYAYLSMRDGDFFGKKFGDSTDANGEDDGTNGEDYFILHMYSIKINGDTIGTTKVTLADFTFADNTKDYILDSWKNIDLTPLNKPGEKIAYITFGFESSDNGDFGMNTPAYFAMDNFSVDNQAGIGEESVSLIKVYPNPFSAVINLDANEGTIRIFDAMGRMVIAHDLSVSSTIETSTLPAGAYRLTLLSAEGLRSAALIKK